MYPIPGLGWDHIGDLGDPTVGYLSVRVQRNAAFWAAGAILEEYDGSWRSRTGRNDGAFYKAEAGGFRTYATATALAASLDFDKKDPDDGDYTDVWQLTQVLNQSPSPTKTAWIWANINVPEMVEYMAVTAEIRHWDSGGKNYYVYRDASSTGRWEILHWDLDGILSGGSDTKGDFVTPDITGNKLYKSLFEVPEIKEMYFRRLRSLHDQYLTIPLPSNPFVSTFAALTTPNLDADRILDKNKWGGGGNTLSSKTTKVNTGITERRTQIAAHTNATEVPISQSSNPNVVINEIQYNPGSATGNEEFLELHNPSTTEAVDISGWVLTGVGSGDTDWTIPNGTVIPKDGYVVFVSHDTDFRAAYPGNHFVGGQFTGGLSSSGETITLKKGATVVDSVSYSPLAPWPTTPNGTGPSLELKNPTLDNSLDTSWLASTNTGTPNAKNTAFGGGGGGGGGTGCSAANPTLGLRATPGATWPPAATWARRGGRRPSTTRPGRAALACSASRTPALATTIPSTSGRTTYYFRTDVNVADASTITSATLNAVLDDGAVVYVNGVEAGRANLAARRGELHPEGAGRRDRRGGEHADRHQPADRRVPHRHQHHRRRGPQQGQRPRRPRASMLSSSSTPVAAGRRWRGPRLRRILEVPRHRGEPGHGVEGGGLHRHGVGVRTWLARIRQHPAGHDVDQGPEADHVLLPGHVHCGRDRQRGHAGSAAGRRRRRLHQRRRGGPEQHADRSGGLRHPGFDGDHRHGGEERGEPARCPPPTSTSTAPTRSPSRSTSSATQPET